MISSAISGTNVKTVHYSKRSETSKETVLTAALKKAHCLWVKKV